MDKPNLHKRMAALVMALALLPLFVSAQTIRGDVDWDGDFDISDVTTLIDYVLHGRWSDIPTDMETETFTVNGESFEMVHVDGGILTRADGGMYYVGDFWICRTEVTRELWATLMGGTPDNRHCALSQHTWLECQAFIDSLNAVTGGHFRFPTWNEWEFAARGGNRSLGYTYCGGNDLDVVGWYKGNSRGVKPVAGLRCNELGLYDMSGNVAEWTQTIYPAGSSTDTGQRIICGGNFAESASDNTAARQWYGNCMYGYSDRIGFRLAM